MSSKRDGGRTERPMRVKVVGGGVGGRGGLGGESMDGGMGGSGTMSVGER